MPTLKLKEKLAALVDASADAGDDAVDVRGQDASLRETRQADANLRALKDERRQAWAKVEHDSELRARSKARDYDKLVRERYVDQPGFFAWDPNRALDRQDFDYLFFHRRHLKKHIRTYLEIIASKITHVTQDGEDGYFNKLERNIGWTRYITPLVFAGSRDLDKIVRCGLWANAHNSRRCHKPDVCPLCLWNDVLKVLAAAFGVMSGAFERAAAWWLITLGWTTNPNNAKCVVKDVEPADSRGRDGDHSYDPYPVRLGGADDHCGDSWLGYEDARILGLIMQDALDDLYQSGLVDGYYNKLEGAFSLGLGPSAQPYIFADEQESADGDDDGSLAVHPKVALPAPNRVNFHAHAVANGSETDGQVIARRLQASVRRGLKKYGRLLTRPYYPDIVVGKVQSAEHLERASVYSEKVAALDLIYAEAVNRPEARNPDGTWSEDYVSRLGSALYMLVDEDIPAIFSGYRLDHDFHRLHRRKTVGNMVFTDRGTCIGDEPDWHRKLRHKKAKQAREYRQRKKDRQAEEMANGGAVQHPKPNKRRRKNPRRLSRSLRSRARPASALQEGTDHDVWSPRDRLSRNPACIGTQPPNRKKERIQHKLARAQGGDPFKTLNLDELEFLMMGDSLGKPIHQGNLDSNDEEY